eukprot:14591963-Heterocapsa_arctica.AAC.1
MVHSWPLTLRRSRPRSDLLRYHVEVRASVEAAEVVVVEVAAVVVEVVVVDLAAARRHGTFCWARSSARRRCAPAERAGPL